MEKTRLSILKNSLKEYWELSMKKCNQKDHQQEDEDYYIKLYYIIYTNLANHSFKG